MQDTRSLRALFFYFLFLAYSGVLHAVGRKEKKHENKKHTEHERMYFFVRLSTRGMPYTHASHTGHEGKYPFGSDIHMCYA